MPSKIAAIIDPYSSGALLAPAFSRRGYECVMVQSTASVPPVFRSSFRPDSFVETFVYRRNLAEVLEQLRSRGVQIVVAGCELGVELADKLSESLGLISNGTRLTKARRNKFAMAQQLRSHGLRCAAQFCANRPDRLVDWISANCEWPVVVKPVASSGSDRVSLCTAAEEVERCFREIVESRNVLGLTNDSVLVQEFLDGTEFIVDTVSYQGRHRVAGFWRYGKRASSRQLLGYNSMELLPFEGEIQKELTEYVASVLDAVGIEYGAAHSEVMLVDSKPVLVEVAARMSAGNNAVLNRWCSGVCQLDLTVDAFVSPDRFLARVEEPYELVQFAANVFLMPQRRGRLKALGRVRDLENLPTLHSMSIGVAPGEPIPRVAGRVTLLHSDRAAVRRDVERIHSVEENGLYQIDEEETGAE